MFLAHSMVSDGRGRCINITPANSNTRRFKFLVDPNPRYFDVVDKLGPRPLYFTEVARTPSEAVAFIESRRLGEAGQPTRPGRAALVTRMVAGVVLAPCVRLRVRHPLVRGLMAMLAEEVGRFDVALELEHDWADNRPL